MADDDGPAGGDRNAALVDLGQKLDTVAGAIAAIAASHNDLLGHVAEAEARRSQDAHETAQRLDAIERQVLAQPAPTVPPPSGAPGELGTLQADVTLSLDVLARVAEGIERLDDRTEDRLAAVRERVEGIDVAGSLAEVTNELSGRLALHTDTALAGALRMIDDRLAALRDVVANAAGTGAGSAQAGVGGFEAGAVMGAAQAAWNRLEQRLDSEFDDLGRQLQSMSLLIEQATIGREAAGNRPVVTGDQLRKAASVVKKAVISASRSRREGPRGLGSGS